MNPEHRNGKCRGQFGDVECATRAATLPDPMESFRPAGSSCVQKMSVLVEQSTAGEFDGFGHSCQRNTTSPSLAANELPGMSVGHVVQDLPHHDASTLEGGFAMTDQGVGDDMLTEFNRSGFAIGSFHVSVSKQDALGEGIWQARVHSRSALPCAHDFSNIHPVNRSKAVWTSEESWVGIGCRDRCPCVGRPVRPVHPVPPPFHRYFTSQVELKSLSLNRIS